jgi:uncharacterized YccA/Bax inhibitor family protein
MALFKSSNPALKENILDNVRANDGEVMTVNGTINKTGFLLLMLLVTAVISWTSFATSPELLMPFLIGGAVGGLIVGIIIIFKREWAPALAPAYALLEGLVLGSISAAMNAVMPGIVLNAVFLTIGVFVVMLVLYRTRVIKVTDTFRMVVVSATAGIALLYIITFVLGLFGVHIPYINETGTIGIVFSLVVVTIAALNLALDFDFIDKGAAAQAPKYFEWYAAFGLLVTLVWLYLEILRLLSKLNRR